MLLGLPARGRVLLFGSPYTEWICINK